MSLHNVQPIRLCRSYTPQECDGRVCPQLQVVCSVTMHLSLALCHVMEMSSTVSLCLSVSYTYMYYGILVSGLRVH